MKNKFTHWQVLFIEYIKRDWKLILCWVLGFGAFVGGFVPAFVEIGKDQGLLGLYETMKNPAMIGMCGPTPVKEAAEYTVGAMYSQMMLVFSALIAMILSALHVVSHTRKEEESGLTEFVCAYRVGRHAGSLALLLEELLIHALLTVFVGGMMSGFGVESVEAGPSFLFAASVALGGLMGAAIALLVAQLLPTATGATGSAMGVIGALYMLRAVTDVSAPELSIWTPMGWTYLTYPFTENNAVPLLYMVIFSVAVVILAFVLERGRDMGSGYIPQRAGSAKIKKSLLSVPGLLCRLNKPVIVGWLLTFLVLGAMYGSIYGDMQTFLEGNELIRMMFTVSGVSIEASFTSTILVVLGGLCAILPVVVVNRLFTEESHGRMAQLFATKVTKAKLYWTTMLLAAFSGAAALFMASAGLGGTAVSVMETASLTLSDFLSAGMGYFPAVLFMTALAALMLGFAPKLGKYVYVYIGYALILNYFQGILKLPEWVQNTAVLSYIPRLASGEENNMALIVLTVLSILMMAAGYTGYAKRDRIEQI